MNTTIFLAQVWGPIMVAIGIGFFVSRSYYVSVYRDLERAPFAGLLFGIAAMAIGIVQILSHNVWDSFTQGFVSVLGWGVLVKGAVFLIVPSFADRSGDWWVTRKFLPFAGIAMLVIGVYLTWVGYIA